MKYPLYVLLLLALSACGEAWQTIHAREHARITEYLDPCRSEARELVTNVVLCRAGDCQCHAELARRTLARGGHTFYGAEVAK